MKWIAKYYEIPYNFVPCLPDVLNGGKPEDPEKNHRPVSRESLRTSVDKAMANLSISRETDTKLTPVKSTSAENSRKWRERKKQDKQFLESERNRKKLERKSMTTEMKARTREKARLRQQSFRQRKKENLSVGVKNNDGLISQDISNKRRRSRNEDGIDNPAKKSQRGAKKTSQPYDDNETSGSKFVRIHKAQTSSDSQSEYVDERFLQLFAKKPSYGSSKNMKDDLYIAKNIHENTPTFGNAVNKADAFISPKNKTKFRQKSRNKGISGILSFDNITDKSVIEDGCEPGKQRSTVPMQSSNVVRREHAVVDNRFTGHEVVEMDIVETPCSLWSNSSCETFDVDLNDDESVTTNLSLQLDDDSISCLLENGQLPFDIMETTVDPIFKVTDNTTLCNHEVRSNQTSSNLDRCAPSGDCEIISSSRSSSCEDLDVLSYSNRKDPLIWNNDAFDETSQADDVDDIPIDHLLLQLTNDNTDCEEITDTSTDSDIYSLTDQLGQDELSKDRYHLKRNCQNEKYFQKFNMINNYRSQVQKELQTIENEANSVRQQVSERKRFLQAELKRWEELCRETCDNIESENKARLYLHNMLNHNYSQTSHQHALPLPKRKILQFKPADNISEESMNEFFGMINTLSLH